MGSGTDGGSGGVTSMLEKPEETRMGQGCANEETYSLWMLENYPT